MCVLVCAQKEKLTCILVTGAFFKTKDLEAENCVWDLPLALTDLGKTLLSFNGKIALKTQIF